MILDNIVAPTCGSADSGGTTDDEEDTVVSEDETSLILEFTVAAGDFVLSETLDAVPEETLEFERIIPTTETPLPYLWVTGENATSFEDAATDDPTIDEFHCVARFETGALYNITWTECADTLVTWFRDRSVVVLQAETVDQHWHLKLRVDSREALGDLQAFCQSNDINFDVVRLYRLTEPKMGQFDVSQKQYDTLLLALEMGYFDIPRGATLEDIADRLDISTRAASERLRRGQKNLLSNSLTIGEPTGIGVGEEQ